MDASKRLTASQDEVQRTTIYSKVRLSSRGATAAMQEKGSDARDAQMDSVERERESDKIK